MSDGAVGPTAHRAFAEAINSMAEKFMALLELEGSDSPGYSERLNKRPTSGSGEGGEHRSRYPGGAMEKACSKAKQIASGRFGADAWYIVSIGDDGELQIKIGQGAKPGQGGQIDGGKIDERLARQRGTLAGVTLVSPPPQHDIYSIEDLKRLIGDLREAYPEVKTISVKVTTKAGIGTIVSGIAKAGAQKATLSGNSGGTGAAESSAIRYTGSPGELGLFETLHTLKKQGMFNKIIIECDGGLITGRDIVAMAVHGSDEFGFGSSLEQAAAACIFCRDCAINTCPVGLNTTLIENLARLGFGGKAEAMLEKMESMTFEEQAKNIGEALELYWVTLAEDVRGILAMIGVESLEACRGRFDVVKRLYGADRERLKISRIADEDERAKAEANLESRLDAGEKYPEDRVNLDFLWKEPDYEVPDFGDEPIVRPNPVNAVNQMMVEAAKSFDGDRLVMEIPLIGSAEYKGENYDGGMRAIGSTLACEIARGNVKVPLGGFHFKFKGYPGQSFGFLNVEGVTLELTGIANDFVGSGMSGGKIIIKPPAHLQSEEPIDLAGATCAYGARKHSDDQMTGGKLFVAGKIGQRFGVRCCLDAVIICEGCDNFGFEYTTGGVGVVLGEVGSGFASGMSAGEVFVLNENGTLVDRLNKEDARIVPMNDVDKVKLHALLTEYYADTASPKAARILQNWEAESLKFARVISTYEPKPQQISDLARKRLADMARDGGVLPVIADMIV
ncbi:hypothetical protein HYW82_03815 [Candidatus Peregrinibacteria bacterium]|nr:hypothetical protein [Candidatus Peregrinibacteria bacterium]